MVLPDCYDPIFQEDRRQRAWDRFAEDLPVCNCCGHSVYPEDHFYEKNDVIICAGCKVELDDNERILEDR